MADYADDSEPNLELAAYTRNALCRILSNGYYHVPQVDYGGITGWGAPMHGPAWTLPVHVDGDKYTKIEMLAAQGHARSIWGPFGCNAPKPNVFLYSVINDPGFVCEMWSPKGPIASMAAPPPGSTYITVDVYYVFWP